MVLSVEVPGVDADEGADEGADDGGVPVEGVGIDLKDGSEGGAVTVEGVEGIVGAVLAPMVLLPEASLISLLVLSLISSFGEAPFGIAPWSVSCFTVISCASSSWLSVFRVSTCDASALETISRTR